MLPFWVGRQVRQLSPVVASTSGGAGGGGSGGGSGTVAEVTVLSCAPNGTTIAAGYSDGTVRLADEGARCCWARGVVGHSYRPTRHVSAAGAQPEGDVRDPDGAMGTGHWA